MKKLIVAITMLFLLNLYTTVYALSKDQVALGGIPIDASIVYVNEIYGHPTHIEGGDTWISHYGNGFLVYSSPRPFNKDSHYKKGVNYVDQIVVTQNNGIATPDGAYVGMKETVIEEIYGKPFSNFIAKDDVNVYWYFGETKLLEFKSKNGLVISIRITETD